MFDVRKNYNAFTLLASFGCIWVGFVSCLIMLVSMLALTYEIEPALAFTKGFLGVRFLDDLAKDLDLEPEAEEAYERHLLHWYTNMLKKGIEFVGFSEKEEIRLYT